MALTLSPHLGGFCGERRPVDPIGGTERRSRTCEDYGKDLLTGATLEETEYRALNPDGKAILKACEYVPPHELPDREHPL